MVHDTEIRATELCYVLHGTLLTTLPFRYPIHNL